MPVGESIELGLRLRDVREELYGEHGGPALAEEMRIPARTLSNYESGVVMPALILLRFIAITGACPGWLLDGRGSRYPPCDSPGSDHRPRGRAGVGR